jgi:hypothetical protein
MSSEKEEEVSEKINENKLSISRAIRNMDAIIDSLSEGKKSLHSKTKIKKYTKNTNTSCYTNSSCTC